MTREQLNALKALNDAAYAAHRVSQSALSDDGKVFLHNIVRLSDVIVDTAPPVSEVER